MKDFSENIAAEQTITIYGISDLHLSISTPKPMDIFGAHWENHAKRIAEAWDAKVKTSDIVLIAGDTSWAMKLNEALPDIDYIISRPGRKIMIRGNHDYWWGRESTNKIQRMLGDGITLLNGTSTTINGIGIAGTRGWRLDDIGLEGPEHGDIRIFNREIAYLRRALENMPDSVSTKIVMLHYPPFNLNLESNEFREVLEEFGANILVYGHVHKGIGSYLEGDIDGIEYHLVAADHIGFQPKPIMKIT